MGDDDDRLMVQLQRGQAALFMRNLKLGIVIVVGLRPRSLTTSVKGDPIDKAGLTSKRGTYIMHAFPNSKSHQVEVP